MHKIDELSLFCFIVQMNLTLQEIEKLNELGTHVYKMVFFTRDFIIVPIILFLIIWLLNKTKESQPLVLQKYYLKGYYFRLLMIPLFLFQHVVLYPWGVDAFNYFWASDQLIQLVKVKPSVAWFVLTHSVDTLQNFPFNFDLNEFYFKDNESFLVKITFIINLLIGNSFLGSSLIASFYAYIGTWKIYKILNQNYPGHEKILFFSTVLLPSVAFWSSISAKEAYCIGAMGFVYYALTRMFEHKEYTRKNILIFFINAIMLFYIKSYILIALLASYSFFIIIKSFNSIKSNVIKYVSLPATIALLVFGLLKLMDSFQGQLQKFALKNILETIKTNYDYLTQEGFAASRYTLGELSPDIGSMIKLVPASINVTLFRPYIWEANKIMLLVASAESTLTLLLTLFVLFKARLFFFKIIFKERFLLMAMSFSLLFSAFIGITSGNFGTLMRYKIPMMPFYFSALAIIYILNKEKKSNESINQSINQSN